MFNELELDAESIPGYKLGAHIVQIIISLVAWCLEIAVFRAKDSKVNGQNGWAFAVCFLSIPAWIYLIGAPRAPRTRKFAEPHVMVAVDALFLLLWLSAFAAQAAYNSSGKCGDGCSESKAIVAMGVFETLLFGLTLFMSIYTLKFYQFNGRLPGYDRLGSKKNAQNIDPDMAAFSTTPHDEEYARINNMDADYDDGRDHGAPSAYDAHAGDMGYNNSSVGRRTDLDTGYGGAPTSSVGGGGYNDTSYGGAASTVSGPSGYSNTTSHNENPFDDGGHLPNPFDDHNLRPAASAASLNTSAVGQSSYMQPTVEEAYDDNRPVKFPQATTAGIDLLVG